MVEPGERGSAAPAGPPAQDRVAAALNRALEEQVAEQRALITLIAEVRERLGGLDAIGSTVDDAVRRGVGSLSAQLRESGDALAGRVEELQRRAAATDDALRGLPVSADLQGLREESGAIRGLLGSVGAQLATVREELGGLPSSVEDLGDGIAGVRTDLRQLPTHVGAAVGGRVAEPLEALRVVMRELAADVELLGEGVAPLEPGLTGIEEQLAGLAARVAALGPLPDELRDLDARLGAHLERLPALLTAALPEPDSALGDLHSDVRLLAAAVSSLPEQLPDAAVLDEILAQVVALDGRVSRVEDAVGRQPPADPSLLPIAELAASVGIVGGGVATLSDVMQGATQDLASLGARLADLEERLDGLGGTEEQLAGLGARLAGLAATADRTAELADQLASRPPLEIPEALSASDIGDRVDLAVRSAGAPVATEVASLRGDLDTLRRLVLEDLHAEPSDVTEALRATIREEVQGAVREVVADAVREAVERAAGQTAAAEGRLRQHVDEAVLALAEIVLRGSAGQPRRAAAPSEGAGAASADVPVVEVGGAAPPPEGSPEAEAARRRWFGKG